MMSADARMACGVEWGKITPFFRNLILRSRRILVRLLSSEYLVAKYSHDRMQKNRASMRSCTQAVCQGVEATWCIFLRTEAGRAFCFFLSLSSFLYPLHCSCKRKQVLPSASNRGSFLAFARKACDTYETVALTVPSARCSLFLLEKVHSLTACAKAEMTMFLWN